MSSEFGVIVFEVEAPQRGVIRPEWSWFDTPLPRRFRRRDGILGFAVYRDSNRHYVLLPPTAVWGVSAPYPFVVALLAIAPAVWLARRHRQAVQRTREARGLCVQCGYDLRATRDRCPECGTISRLIRV